MEDSALVATSQDPVPAPKVNTQHLVEMAENIWMAQAKSRKFRLWQKEIGACFKRIIAALDRQEDELVIAIKRGYVRTDLLNDQSDNIQRATDDVAEWMKQVNQWLENGEIDLLDVRGTLFDPEMQTKLQDAAAKKAAKGAKGKGKGKKAKDKASEAPVEASTEVPAEPSTPSEGEAAPW